MFSRFFIDRPIFASVLSIIITMAGGIAVFGLPIAQYPDITPPTVEVYAIYPGANAQVVADTVAAPIEQQVNGVEGMLYMSSQCTNDGTYTLTVTFQNGVDLNMAQVLVQNRVSLAQPILPDLVRRRGVTVKKKSPSVLMIVNLFSPDRSRDNLYLSNYATIQLRDELARLNGVGDITYLGQRDYSMRLWLDPEKMNVRGLTANDVVHAIEQQNTQVAAGQLGQPPVASGQVFQFTMSTMGRLTDVEQFADMILKTDPRGRLVRLSDVANIELGAQAYDQVCTLNGQPSVALSIYQLPGSNALEVAKQVRTKMVELKNRFPDGVDYAIVYDTTPFINQSIREVFKTLRDATILVAIVVLLFLQNWRSAIIPLVAVPVAIIGTFAAMAAMSFSLNNLTLFGLVLAIGIVVDDAIVVVEAVEHHIEHGLPPREATIKAMSQVASPVIAVGLVLSAVFVPCAFISGITGQFFRQFALTIAVSTLISAFNSLTLSPALTALLLRPQDKGTAPPLPRFAFPLVGAWLGWEFLTPWVRESVAAWESGSPLTLPLSHALTLLAGAAVGWLLSRPLNRVLGASFRAFNAGFGKATGGYVRLVGGLLRVSVVVLVVYGGLLALTYVGFAGAPKGFIPTQDKGYLLVNVQLPDSASVQRTQQVMRRIEEIALRTLGVKHTVAVAGQSVLLNANAPNFGAMFVMLDDFRNRTAHGLSGDAIAAQLQEALQKEIRDGLINVFGAPPLEGLGTAGGFKIVVEDRGDTGLKSLQNVADDIVASGSATGGLQGLFTSFRANTPWLYLNIDRIQAKTMAVSMGEVFNTLQVYLGSLYINDFNRFGRTWQVNVQASADFRKQIEDLQQLTIRSEKGKMVPLGTIATVQDRSGPVLIMRYNMYQAAAVNVTPAPGVSSGQAIDLTEDLVRQKLVRSMRSEWTELALLQLQTGNTAMLVFLLAVVLVFLVLAAQYESWSLPLAVILVVPLCLLFSIAGVLMAHLDVNIFTQVGFVVLVGLACKNAILIVQFAKARQEDGADRYQATLDACRLRLRPIVMTSFAFIFGVLPLVISEGAGAEMRRTLGTAVFGGMLGVTLFGIFLTPVFYYVVQWLGDLRARAVAAERPTRTATLRPGSAPFLALVLCLLAAGPLRADVRAGSTSAAETPYDLLIRNGKIVDGSGNPWLYGDLAVRGDRIVAVGRVPPGPARREIDARGLVVAPGFLDMHSHSDFLLLEDGNAQSKIRQGVTTEVLGEGSSVGPYQGQFPPRGAVVSGKTARWTTLGGYFETLERAGVSTNVASYVGVDNVWQCAMGNSFERPTAAQLEQMKVLVEEAMKDGAFGLSSMLAMPPGSLATTDDLVALCKVVARHGGIYSSHIRNEGAGVFDAVKEAIAVGERAGVAVDIIHLKIADQQLWGRMNEVVALVEEARKRGLNVQANVYPYTRGNNNLASIIPPWVHEGGTAQMLARLQDPRLRAKIKTDIREGLPGWYNHYTAVGGDWSRMLVSGRSSYEGLTMDRVLAARAKGKEPAPDPLDALFDLLIEEGGSISTVYAHHTEKDMNLALVQPWCSIGSDGSAYATEGPLRRGNPHPRNFGTFPRVLGVYVRQRGLLRLEDAVRKMTSLNAAKLGIPDRGLLRPGNFADLTLFDPERVIDRATYEKPFQYSEGIEYVIVNGQIVLERGKHTGAHPGRALRRSP